MNFAKKTGLFASFVAFAMGLSMPLAAKELTLAHYLPPNHELQVGVAEPLAQELAKATNGAVTIKIYPSGELGAGPTQQYTRALEGIADITIGLTGSDAVPMPRSLMLEMPGLFDTPREAVDVIWANIDAFAEDFKRTQLLALFPNSPAALVMTRPVRSPEDLAGLNIRTSSAIGAAMVGAWGANAVTMPANDLYNAMQTGVVDGALIGIDGVNAFRLHEVATNVVTNLPSNVTMFFVTMNRESYAALSEDERAKLMAVAGRKLSMKGADAFVTSGDKAKANILATEGCSLDVLTDDERAAFSARLDGLADKIIADLSASSKVDLMDVYQRINK